HDARHPLAHRVEPASYSGGGGGHGASYRGESVAASDGGETEGRVRSFVVGATIFLRGDVNADSRIDISDPIATLGYLFLGTSALACDDAADFDDSGGLDITDAILELQHLFVGGAPLPFPQDELCGIDPTADELGCASPGACE